MLKCFWCRVEWASLEIVAHSIFHHPEECIKYQEYVLDDTIG